MADIRPFIYPYFKREPVTNKYSAVAVNDSSQVICMSPVNSDHHLHTTSIIGVNTNTTEVVAHFEDSLGGDDVWMIIPAREQRQMIFPHPLGKPTDKNKSIKVSLNIDPANYVYFFITGYSHPDTNDLENYL